MSSVMGSESEANRLPAKWTLADGPLKQLRELESRNRSGLVAKAIRLFLEQAPGWIASLDAAVEQADPDAVKFAAHTLKSSSAMMGALGLSSVCEQLELLGRQGDLDVAGPLLIEAKTGFASVEAQLEAVLATSQVPPEETPPKEVPATELENGGSSCLEKE